jgi:hypothetical protein
MRWDRLVIPTRFVEFCYSSLRWDGGMCDLGMALKWRWDAAYTPVFHRGLILGRKIFCLTTVLCWGVM